MKLLINCTNEHLEKAGDHSAGISIALQELFPNCEIGNYDEGDKSLIIGSGKDIIIIRLPRKVQREKTKPFSFKIDLTPGQIERINEHYGHSFNTLKIINQSSHLQIL